MRDSVRKKRAFIALGLVVLMIGGIWMLGSLFGKKQNEIGAVTELTSLNLRLSGMRVTEEYELLCDGETTQLSYYQMFYGDGTEQRRLMGSAAVDTATVLQKLNEYGVSGWDGFHGAHPKGVRDGTMFRLEAVVNGGARITADGSENFPQHFSDLCRWLEETLGT